MRKIKILKISLIIIILVILGANSFLSKAKAASPFLFVSPSNGNYKVGDVFEVAIKINPQEMKVDTFEGRINLSHLSCQSVSVSSNVMAVSSPSCGNLYFLLGIPGGTNSTKTLFTIKVKAESEGEAKIYFSGVDILSDGVSVSSNSSGGVYQVSLPCVCEKWSEWENKNCGEGNCLPSQRLQVRKRKCTPSGCDKESESRCIDDSSCYSPTKTSLPKTTPFQMVIKAPTHLLATDVPDDRGTAIKLSWRPSSTKNITGYFILRKLSTERYYKLIGVVSKDKTTYIDKECKPGTTYDYIVVAYQGKSWNQSIRSPFSNKATATAIDNISQKSKEKLKIELNIISNEKGKILKEFFKEIFEGKFSLRISQNNICQIENKKPLTKITVKKLNLQDLKKLPQNAKIIKGTIYEISPHSVTCEKEIEIKIKYDPKNIPSGGKEKDIIIKKFDGKKWISLPTKIDFKNHLAFTKIKKLSIFALFIEKKKPTPTPSPFVPTPTHLPSQKVKKIDFKSILLPGVLILFVLAFLFYLKRRKI